MSDLAQSFLDRARGFREAARALEHPCDRSVEMHLLAQAAKLGTMALHELGTSDRRLAQFDRNAKVVQRHYEENPAEIPRSADLAHMRDLVDGLLRQTGRLVERAEMAARVSCLVQGDAEAMRAELGLSVGKAARARHAVRDLLARVQVRASPPSP